MKPPVEAPTSSARRPATSSPSASSALASLTPPRETYGGGASTASSTSVVHELARLGRPRAARTHVHVAGQDRRGGTRAGREQAALRQQAVEPDPGHGRNKVTVIHFTVDESARGTMSGAMFRRLSLTEHGLLELLAALIGARSCSASARSLTRASAVR